MEELQSTEILEREILEDARKKAMRILKSADDAIRVKTAEWDRKTAESISELEKKFCEQKELAVEKIMARLPVDKLRVKVEKIENMLQMAEEAWFKNTGRKRILEIMEKELLKRLSACEEISDSGKKTVFFSALDRPEAEKVLETVNNKTLSKPFDISNDKICIFEEVPSDSHYPSLTLETENIRIIASVRNLLDFLLQEKREELVEALVGSDLTEQL